MTNHSFSLATAAGLLALFAAPCPAQPPGYAPGSIGQPPFTSRPTVSPYLNLLRSGGSPALNYYTLVRPQNQFYQSMFQLQQDVGANARELNSLQQPTTTGAQMSPTGHAFGFMTQAPYFMNLGSAGFGLGARSGQPMGMAGRGGVGSTAGRGGMGMTGMQNPGMQNPGMQNPGMQNPGMRRGF
jgi:hypothetical protein